MGDALLVFARLPEPGAVKTRLVGLYTAEQAAELYEASLHDVLELARSVDAVVWVIHTGAGADRYFARHAPDLQRAPQRGSGLGARMTAAFRDAFAAGYSRVAIIGSDSPTLPAHYVASALADLTEGVALGPAEDGGYYLVAIHRATWPAAEALFVEVEWSTATVLEETLSRAANAGLPVRLLPRWYDIDRLEDVERAAEDPGAPRFKQALSAIRAGG